MSRRWLAIAVAVSLVASVVIETPGGDGSPAGAEITTFADGTELEVTIDSPPDGSAPVDGRADLEGTARVGAGDTPADTSLVVVYDLSGSTLDPAGGDCGGDVNGDGRSNTILDCEIAAMEALEQTALALGSVAEMGVVLFELGSAAADVQPDSGIQRLTVPGADLNSNGVTDIADVVRTSRWTASWFRADATVSLFTFLDAGTGNGGTNYSAGLSRACETLAATSQPNRTIVFLSDGAANRGSDVTTVLPCSQPATVHSVAVGANSTCASDPTGRGSLQEVADLTGGTCTEVVSPEDLPDILTGIISPEIYRLGLSVNGGPEIDISDSASVPLPALGPDPIDWATTVDGLAGPVDEICVTAYAQRDTEQVDVTECITLISDRPPVADAGPDQTVAEGSLVELDGTGSFDPDGDPLSYEWEIVSQTGAPIVLSSTTEAEAAFIAFDDGEYELSLTVSDGRTPVTDTTMVTVTNEAPDATALAEPAAEGGVALITASFTDPGLLDTHEATIDWGDGTPVEPIHISAQGNGWGSMFATHVYGGPGSFTASITVVDDDGGSDTVASVSVEVGDSLAIWAGSETAGRTIDWRGGVGTIEGLVHSNNAIRVRGDVKSFVGPVEYAGSISTNNNTSFSEPAVQTPAGPFPVEFDIADYRPGGRAAVDAGTSYFDMSSECGDRWDPVGPLQSGLYYVPCEVKLNASALAGTITVATEAEIQVSGADADFEPFIDGLLFLSGSAANQAVQISSSDSTYLGYLFAADGRIDLAGAGNTYLCGILGDRIDITDDVLSIRASDCIRPERTVAPPSLVPELDLGVTVTPAEVLPGDVAATTTEVTNTGSLLLVPGVVGLENLGDAAVTVTAIDLGIEYLPVGGSWTPLAEPPTISGQPNPSPGVTYPAGGDPFVGTVIEPDGLATWGAEIQVFLPAATVAFLLDPAQVQAVRNVFDFTLDNPTSEPVRGLFRFGTDFAPELRDLGGDLTDVSVVTTATDGSTAIIDPTDEPSLALLGPGESTAVAVDATVAVPEPRGTIEPVDAYLDRLAALDGTELAGSAFAVGTGGVGSVLGPFAFDTTVRSLPILSLGLAGPDLLVAGDTATYDLETRNTGSAGAVAVTSELVVDGTALPTGLPSAIDAGAIESASVDQLVPPDRPVGLLDADATISWQDTNGNPYGDVDAAVTTEIGSPPDLSALLADALAVDADNSGLPSGGDTVRWTATITNRGTTPTGAATFTAPLDPASTVVAGSLTTSQGSIVSGSGAGDTTVVVDIGSIAPMSSVEIAFEATINAGAAELTVQGVVAATGLPDVLTDDPGEPGLADPTVTQVVETPPSLQAALAVRLSIDADGDGFPGPGDTLGYAIQITNAGLTAATTVVATVEPDPNTDLVVGSVVTTSADVVEGNNPGDTRVVASLASVAGLSSNTIEYQVTIDDPLPDGTTEVVSQGTVASDQLADVLTDDPRLPGADDPTVIPVVVVTGGGPGGGPGGGGPAPVFDAVTPADGTVVTTPIAITAGVTPPPGTTIESWQVVAYPAGGDPASGIVLDAGTGDLPTGDITTFDPTVLSNGTWIIQVQATDSDGGIGTSETSVTVEGELKLGRYAVTYEDASVTVAGIPIRVQRTYDTIARTQTADFGYGWSLDVANFEVASNRPLGEGPWTAEACGAGLIFVPLCWSADSPRRVNVTWPSGKVESFELAPTGNTFLSILVSAAYEPRPGTTSELRPAPGTETAWLIGGNLTDGFFGLSGTVYNPDRFVLVAADGTEYLLDRDDGLVQATDRYGNTVTYTDAGIVSSLGPSLDFTRDAEGRIVALTEPTGDTVSYTYDAAGDLVSVVDQIGDETTFTYDSGHYLTVIDDPGPGPFRTLNYGPDGRIESITDAEGNTTAISVDVDGRSQVVTAPDGNSTRVTTYDERGNPTTVDNVYDGQSHVSTLTYDANDRVTSRTDPLGNTWSASWDDGGNLASFTDPEGNRTSYVHGDFGLPVAITDPTGATRTFEYDSVGNLVAIDHPAGATSGITPLRQIVGGRETFTYDAAGNVLTRTNELGAQWQWAYDGNGNIVSVTDPLGATMSFTYDAAGRMLTWTDGEGAVTSYTYNGVGDLIAVTDPNGRTRSWEYDARGEVTALTDPLGNRFTYTYDDTANLTSMTDPTGRTTTWDYAFGRVVRTTDPAGAITQYAYDAAGRMSRMIDPLGRTFEYGYDDADRWISTTYPYGDGLTATEQNVVDGNGRTITYVDGDGGQWSYVRDEMGRVVESRSPLNETASTEFDPLGRPIRLTDGLGNDTTLSYDAAGQLIAIVSADGGRTDLEYDLAGNQIAETDPLGRRTTYAFDDAYRAVSATDALGNVATATFNPSGQLTQASTFAGVSTTFAYDGRGYLAAMTDGLGNTESYGYDAAGRQISSTDPRGNTTTYGYDAAGRETSITDALGGTVVFERDLAGQVTGIVEANGERRIFGFDDAGLITAETDALGRTWQYSYDARGLQRSTIDPRGVTITHDYDATGRIVSETTGAESITYEWNAASRRTSMTDSTGTTVWRYDDVGRITSVEAPGGTVGYTYDLGGQRIGMTQPEGAVSYTYDGKGYLSSITDWNADTIGFTTDADGRPLTITRPNGVSTTHAYDAAGRVISIEHHDGAAPVAGYDYLLDPNGNRSQVTITQGGSTRVEQYTHDALDRLVAVDYGDGVSEAFEYDAAGNRTRRTVTGGPAAGVTTYAYDSAQQLTSVTDPSGSRSLGYDAAGNLVDDGLGATYAWDTFGRLSSVSGGAASQTYTYDGDDVRVGVDGVDQVWDRVGGLPRLISDGSAGYVHAGGRLIAEDTPGGTLYPLGDALGSIRAVTDSSGAVTSTAEYEAFGAVRAGSTNTFGFTSEQSDPTGLLYLRARLYDPTVGRMLSHDTVQPNAPGTQGYNPYSYVNGNPTTFIDPSGHVATVEYASLARNAVITQVALRLLGLCIKGILEGIAFGLLFAATFGFEYEFEWEWALIDCALELVFAGFGPPSGPRPRKPPSPDPPRPKPDAPNPPKPDAPPRPRPDRPRGPDGPNRPRDPDTPDRPRNPDGADCSFSADTEVLMADGSTRPISSIEVGDWVTSLDPETGERGPRQVTHVWVHEDALVDVSVDGDTVATTSDHPFWNQTDGAWQGAVALDQGDLVLAADGDLLEVDGPQWRSLRTATAYNLTVDGLHTFFVQVGDDQVLVHNTCNIPKAPRGRGDTPPADRDPRREFTKQEKTDHLENVQGGNCAGCDQPLDPNDAIGHHSQRHADGGPTTPDNLEVVCAACHKWIHGR